jgi:shikimate 5-dehydrogenase
MSPSEPLASPTFYFIGVSTSQSSIMSVFPKWSSVLGLGAVIAGYDVPLKAPREAYREVVRRIKEDPLAKGALVTSHKLDLYRASADLFEVLDPYARLCDEISCISKRDGALVGHAKDPISSLLALDAFVPTDHFGQGGEVLCLGAGGAALAISVTLASRSSAADRPERFTLVDVDPERLEHTRNIHQKLPRKLDFRYLHNADPRGNDDLMEALPPGSMVINATGLGKDRPGSPITDDGVFPYRGLVWELNYRGELDFLHQARQQRPERALSIEDGWNYFLHGWTQVMAEVFTLELTPALVARLEAEASEARV